MQLHLRTILKFGVIASSILSTTARSYSLTDNWVGQSFYNSFSFQAIDDPTHGRVEYISQATAKSLNLSYASNDHFIMRADSNNVVNKGAKGRKAIRIESNKSFGANTVLVADIRHMPVGCGTWPALWTTRVADWPNSGEIDIIEGVNDVAPNRATLHTTSGCSMISGRKQTGNDIATNCDVNTSGNAGCGVAVDRSNSYGPGFNSAGGGWYALERTNDFIKVWFWSRNDGSVPTDVKTQGQSKINTDNWATPFATFSNQNCPLSSKFGQNNVIINLTFCGDWCGQQELYQSAGCPSTCNDYVDKNPSAFRDAYWDLAAIRMYAT